MCGIIALAGVVVNDSLVMIDFINKFEAAGLTRTVLLITTVPVRELTMTFATATA